MRDNASLGALAIASGLGRSTRSVRSIASRLGISLRRPGVACGLLLTQPRGQSWRSNGQLREGVISGTFDIAEAVARIRAERQEGTELCPKCAARPITHRNTGLCGVCHYRALAQQWREQNAEREAMNEYHREKKRARRRVICPCGADYSPRLDEQGRKSDRNLCPACRAKAESA